MSCRTAVNLAKQHPASYQALLALSAAAQANAEEVGLDPLLVELVKLRTSQINGCAFCLRLHTRDALVKGETSDRLAVLSAWRETTYFTPQERAALAVAERVTLVADAHAGGHDASSPEDLSAAQVGAVAWLSTVMNAFNRVAITSRYDVSP